MKRMFLLSFCLLSLIASSSVSQTNSLNSTFWEGNKWTGNVNQGPWFPSFDTTAVFSIDDFSWGEIRTLGTVALGDSLRVSNHVLLNSGGINGDMAFWGVGDQWVFYGGGTFIGIQMRDGKVFWYQNSTTGDSIGTYIVGEPITITLNLNTNGTLTAKSSRFNSTITPASLPSTKKWMMASANSTPRQGFQVWSASPKISSANWEGNKWTGNVNQGPWFPSFDTTAVFSIDDFSWGEIRTLGTVALGVCPSNSFPHMSKTRVDVVYL